jgi:PPOX class probable F420-dependent enzyme
MAVTTPTRQSSPPKQEPAPPVVPDDLVDLLTSDRLGHVSAVRPDGSVAQYLMWIDWDGEHVLTSSALGSRKGRHWRRDPQVAVSVVDRDDPWRFLIIRGRVTAIRPDDGLAFIDKMSERYTGSPYRWRDSDREIFVITPDHVTPSGGRGR